jgi:integrase
VVLAEEVCPNRIGRWPLVRAHLATEGFTEPGNDGRLFVGPKNATPKRQNFHRIWKQALGKAQVNPDLHLHDLRHTGGTLTAHTGATLKEIMARLGQVQHSRGDDLPARDQ